MAISGTVLLKGVEAERCASFSSAMKAGKPVHTPAQPTLADGTVPAINLLPVPGYYRGRVLFL